MNIKKLAILAFCGGVAGAALATNYTPTWANDQSITIGDVKYSDLLSSSTWGGTDPTTFPEGDNILMGGSANISISASASLRPTLVASTYGSKQNINLNGKTLTVPNKGLRNMSSNIRITLSNGTLKLGTNLLWPDRSAAGNDIRHDNVLTVTGGGTTLDANGLYFGSNMGNPSLPGQGYGNKVIVTNGAFMAASIRLAWNQSFSGAPNGLYVTGSGTVFSNKEVNSKFYIQSTENANTYSNEFVVADGAVVKGMDWFWIGAVRDLNYGVGHLLAFRGANTAHTFKNTASTLGLSHRLEVDGASVTYDTVTLNNYGIVTVKNGGSLVGKVNQFGTLFLTGNGSRISTTAFAMNQNNIPPIRTYVTDRAKLLMGTGSGLQFGANGNTNASLYVRSGGMVTCGSMDVGYATTNLLYSIAPYGCVFEVDGVGSVASNTSMTVGTAYSGADYFTGCGTNGHDNVVRIKNGGKVHTSGDVSIGFVCASNALEVLDGGRLECGILYIGRAGSGWVGAVRADKVAFDNRCVVAGGEIQSTGLVSIRGNNSLCYVTNGVIHTTCTNILETTSNTGYLQIAGTNSLLKGDVEFRASAVGAKIDFVLPSEGYVRAPIQSDNLVKFVDSVDIGFIPPAPGEKVARAYTLAQVPASGTLTVPNALLTSLRTKLAALAAQDARFEEHAVVVKVENGFRRLQLATPSGTLIMFK